MTDRDHHETRTGELLARIERQAEIICDLLMKNEKLRIRLRHSGHSSHSGLIAENGEA